jgi:hypothetical protein
LINQLVLGLALTVIQPVISAFALGLVDEKQVAARVGRNETLTHTGNIAFAAIAAIAGMLGALQWIFIAAALFAGGMALSALAIRESDVNYERSRAGSEKTDDNPPEGKWDDLLRDRRILMFATAVVIFNAGNRRHTSPGR